RGGGGCRREWGARDERRGKGAPQGAGEAGGRHSVRVLGQQELSAIADRLRAAERDRAPIAPLTESYPGLEPTDAYAIQLRNIQRRTAPVVRHKVGLTSAAMQQMMGVGEPDYGHLLADMRLAEDMLADAGRYCFPRVEI